MLKLVFGLLLLWFLVWTGILAAHYAFADRGEVYPLIDSKHERLYTTDQQGRGFTCEFRQSKHANYHGYPFTYWWCIKIGVTPTPTVPYPMGHYP